MDLKALSYFVAVVEEGSVTAAAGRCFVAQPSISHAINKLETELELTLFVRQKRGVTITPEGNALYSEAKSLLNHAESIRSRFIAQKESFVMTVSVAQSIAFGYLNELLSTLKAIDKSLQVKLVQQAEQADICLTVDRLAAKGVQFIPLWQDQYCLIIPSQHPLAFKEHISLSDLNGQPFIERSYCDRSSELGEFLRLSNVSLDVAASVDNEEWALSLVEAGVGVSVVPLHQAQDYSHRFVVKELGTIKGLQSVRRSIGVAIPYSDFTNTAPANTRVGKIKQALINLQ